MKYKIEELPFKYFGQDATLNCTIEITDFVTFPPEPDCGFTGGVEVKQFDVIGDVLVIDSDGEELPFTTNTDRFKQAIWNSADWSDIEERLGA